MEEYTNLYVRTDVFLLADAMVNLREQVWKLFQLDLCSFFSLPHLSLQIMLKETEAKVDYMRDLKMIDLVKRNIRGGLSFVNLRHARHEPVARPEEEEEGAEGAEEGSLNWLLLYLDANNLYGDAMRRSLPVGEYEWMSQAELRRFEADLQDLPEDGDTGYVVEVDLEYPEELHNDQNSFPLAPESVEVGWDDLSDYSRHCKEALGLGRRHQARKLTATFRTRRHYLVHFANLKYYLQQGLKLVTVWRGIRFRQAPFVRPFIEKCTRMRMEAPTKTEQDLWKLVMNSLYGKFIESMEKRMDCRFNRCRFSALRNTSSPLYKGSLICGEDFSISFHKKHQVVMKQSWLIGFTVLELSKLTMQRLWYDRIRKRLGNGTSLVMTDTDSFLFRTCERDTESVLRKLGDCMDFSNLPKDHPLRDDSRKKVPGYLKSEVPHAEILEAVALKAKTYALRVKGRGQPLARAKGVAEAAKRTIPFEAYRNCLEEMSHFEVEQHSIRSINHVNKLMRTRKVAFSSFDDKRYLLCAVHSVPYGSKWVAFFEKYGFCHLCSVEKVGDDLRFAASIIFFTIYFISLRRS